MKGLRIQKNKIAIIGFGISGKSVAGYFLNQGIYVDVFEDKKMQDFDQSNLEGFIENSNFEIFYDTANSSKDITQYDYVIASPGVPLTHSLIQKAQVQNIEFATDINIFLRIFRAEYPSGKVVSITGSNGKSTTVSLLYEALKASEVDVYLGGDIGTSPLDFFDHIKTLEPIIILETSSYQLEYLKDEDYFDIAGITNISDNHLNRYSGKKELYAQAKLGGISMDYTAVIVNLDDEESQKYVLPYLKAKSILPVQFKSQSNNHSITLENKSLMYVDQDTKEILVHDVDNMKITGLHNIYNTAFVCAVFTLLDIELDTKIEQAIYEFGGLIHRTQFVDRINSINYINDSKSTSPDATSKALETLGTQKNIILISGGNDKDISYDSMKEAWSEHVEALVLLPGSANSKLQILASRTDVEVLGECNTMIEAVEIATSHVKENGTVLLSPATDSHASFKSFEDRGNQFIECIKNLKN